MLVQPRVLTLLTPSRLLASSDATIGDPCRTPTCWDGIHANATRCLNKTLAERYSDPKVGRCVAIASLGDEITIPQPSTVPGGAAQATAQFIPWAQARNLTVSPSGALFFHGRSGLQLSALQLLSRIAALPCQCC